MPGPNPWTFMLDKRITIQRNTPTQDTAGREVPGWADLSGAINIRAASRVNAKTEGVDTELHRRDGSGVIVWALDRDCGAKINDRIVYGGMYYAVVGVPTDRTNGGLAAGPYIIKSTQRVA